MKFVTRFAIFALIAIVAIWFVNATEWVEIDRTDPPQGPAARDSLYAARKLLTNFGMRLQSRTGLDAMPPPGARLLLTSNDWALLPGRPKQLENWVRNGGHLVIPPFMIGRRGFEWLPVTTREREERKPASAPKPAPPPRRMLDEQGCFEATEADQKLRLCGRPNWEEMTGRAGASAQWLVRGPQGVEALRVPFGSGTVTVAGPRGAFDNQRLLQADNPLLFATAMQADRGALAWTVSEESRERLVPWTWREGWIAVLLVAGAIAAGVWRSAVRFGPIALPKHAKRRSMAEQVAGTARFLRRHGMRALHEAQLRALHETAARHIAGYAQADRRARIAKLAAHTGYSESQLGEAMWPSHDGRKAAAQLQMMETARRRLDPTFSSRSEDRRHANQK